MRDRHTEGGQAGPAGGAAGMDELVRVMKALSDPGRVTILKLLGQGELCACEVMRALGLAQPTISRHMRVLTDAGLVTGRKVGSWVHYRLAGGLGQPPAPAFARAMLEQLSGWLEHDPVVLARRAALAARASAGLPAEPPCAPSKSQAAKKELRP